MKGSMKCIYGVCVVRQVLQFVLEAVRAESFNPATLFLFGCYTIGKERLFLEVARILQRKARTTFFCSLPSAACGFGTTDCMSKICSACRRADALGQWC